MMSKFLKQILMMGIVISIGSSASALETYFDETGEAILKQIPGGIGTGLPTIDHHNILAGVLNVEAVFGVFHENEVVRDMDTRFCAEMGVSKLAKGGRSTGEYCCDTLWITNGPFIEYKGVTNHMGGKLGGRDKKKRNKLKKKHQFLKYCCEMVDDKTKGEKMAFCTTKASEKEGCVKDQIKSGSEMSAALSACDMECKMETYGTFKHNEDGKYDEKELDKILRMCSEDDSGWAPSTTVPGAEEFVPSVPDNVKKNLTKKGTQND